MGDNIHADFLHELLSSTCVPVMFYITDCFLGKIDNRSTTISSNLQCQEEWKLDSGASHRNWFISYQSIDDGVVFMGNGIPCKIFGVGSIRVRIFDGIVRESTDVRYVPELKSNLISLGVLDSCEYK